ncbi:MAG: hypothetical protein OCD76_11305 [Reichenbachiella sp.]
MNGKIVVIGLISLILQIVMLVLDLPVVFVFITSGISSWYMFDHFSGRFKYSVFRQRLIGAMIFLFSILFSLWFMTVFG